MGLILTLKIPPMQSTLIENKTSVTTHFKKLTTGNNAFMVVIIYSNSV